MLLEGMHLPLTTPFHVDGRLNTRKLEDNVVRYSKTPAAGLVVLGRSGQPTLLSDAETREVLRAAAVVTAAGQGYDAALVRVPSYLDGNAAGWRREIVTYFRAIADRAALPVMLESGWS